MESFQTAKKQKYAEQCSLPLHMELSTSKEAYARGGTVPPFFASFIWSSPPAKKHMQEQKTVSSLFCLFIWRALHPAKKHIQEQKTVSSLFCLFIWRALHPAKKHMPLCHRSCSAL
jgi:hypothetical protein